MAFIRRKQVRGTTYYSLAQVRHRSVELRKS